MLRQIEVLAPSRLRDRILSLADREAVLQASAFVTDDGARVLVRLLTRTEGRQQLVDRLQETLGSEPGVTIALSPVAAALPHPDATPSFLQALIRAIAPPVETREELIGDVSQGARFTVDYALLIFLSAVVAAIGLIENSVAVLIGAMVIAPLLAPGLALSLGTATADWRLVRRAALVSASGVAAAVVSGFAVGQVYAPSDETLLVRISGSPLAGAVLALCSGAAAALSLTARERAPLVGVMVAVALLPPSTATGLHLAAGNTALALDALYIVALNVTGINLGAQIAFLAKRMGPVLMQDRRRALMLALANVGLWAALFAAILAVSALAA